MSYEKQNFTDGQTLKAEHLNRIEDELARKKSWDELDGKPFDKIEGGLRINNFDDFPTEFTTTDTSPAGKYMTSISHSLGKSIFKDYVGQTLTIEYDGTEYECEVFAISDPGSPAGAGNWALVNNTTSVEGSNGDAPFFIFSNTSSFKLYAEESGTHTISVKIEEVVPDEYFPMEEGYIPETIARVKDLQSVSWTGLNDKPSNYVAKKIPVFESSLRCTQYSTYNSAYIEYDFFGVGVAVGDKVFVSWDGVDHECQIEMTPEGIMFLGNYSYSPDFVSGDTVTYPDFPFYMYKTSKGTSYLYCSPDSNIDHEIIVYGVEMVEVLNEEIIPETIARKEELPRMEPKRMMCLDNKEFYADSVYGEGRYYISMYNVIGDFGNASSTDPVLYVKEGDAINVIFDGKEYECVLEDGEWDSTPSILQTNKSMYDDETLPFWILFGDNGGTDTFIHLRDQETHTITIYCDKLVAINPIHEELLPESVAGVVVRSSTEGSTKKFKITVDDAGTITATEV